MQLVNELIHTPLKEKACGLFIYRLCVTFKFNIYDSDRTEAVKGFEFMHVCSNTPKEGKKVALLVVVCSC